jgi:hypothetical protein
MHSFLMLKVTYMMMHWNIRNVRKVTWVQTPKLSIFDSPVPRLALGFTQPPIQWILGALFPAVKWLQCEADHLVVRLKIYEAIPPFPYMSSWHGAQAQGWLYPFLIFFLHILKLLQAGLRKCAKWQKYLFSKATSKNTMHTHEWYSGMNFKY